MREAQRLFWLGVAGLGGWMIGEGHALVDLANRRIRALERRP